MANIDSSSQERISQKFSPGSEAKSKKGIIIGISCTVVVLIALVALVLVVLKPTGQTETRNVVVTPDNVDEMIEKMKNNTVQSGQYEVTMNTTWEFEKGDSASTNAYVENSTSNTNDVYFDIVRSDTGETIFSSPTIPVGSHLENITLDSPLEAGTHACVLTYHLLDENGEPISKLNINLEIVVNN